MTSGIIGVYLTTPNMQSNWLFRLFPQLEQRFSELEERPVFDILKLDSTQNYILLFPDSLPQDEFNAICSKVSEFPNVAVITANNLRVVTVA